MSEQENCYQTSGPSGFYKIGSFLYRQEQLVLVLFKIHSLYSKFRIELIWKGHKEGK